MTTFSFDPISLKRGLYKYEPFLPLVLSLHGSALLFFLGGTPWQWVAVIIAGLLGVWGLSKHGQTEQGVHARALGIAVLGWLLMLTSGGVASFFLLWFIASAAAYPFLLSDRLALALVVGLPLGYLCLLPFSNQSSVSLIVVLSRMGLLAFVGGITRVLGASVLEYVSDVSQTAQQLRQSEARFRTIFDTEPECVKLLDQNDLLLEMNQAGLDIVEADSLEQVQQTEIYRLVDPRDQEAFRGLSTKVFNGESATLEFRLKTLKGKRRWLHTHASPLHDEQGQVIALLAVTRDITQQKESEAELALSKEQFRTLFDANPVAIGLYANDGRFIQCNRAWEELLGYSAAELPHVDPTHPEDGPGGRELYEQLVRGEIDHYTREKRFIHRDLHIIWVELTVARVKAPERDTLYLIQIANDITARKEAEDALRATSAQLTNVLNSSPFIHYTMQQERNRLVPKWVSGNLKQHFGYENHEALTPDWWAQHVHPDDRPQAEQNFARMATQDRLTHEYRFARKDGSYAWILDQLQVTRRQDGTPYEVSGQWADISVRKEMETALRTSEERYRSLLEHSGVGMGYFDLDGNIQFFNQRAVELLPGVSDVYVGRSVQQAFGDEWGTILFERIKEIAATGQVVEYEDLIELDEGEVWFASTWAPIPDEAGQTTGVQLVFRNISAEKHAKAELVRQRTFLQSIVQNLPVMIAYFNAAGQIIFCNKEWEQTLGWTLEEMAAETDMMSRFYPDPRQRERAINQILSGGSEWQEYRTATKDGRVLDTVWSNIRMPGGELIGIGQDISERKQAERHIRYQANLLRNVSDAIIGTDLAFNIQSWNKAAERLYGWTAEEVLGKNVGEVLPTSYLDHDPQDVLAEFQAQGMWQGEAIQPHKDGRQIYLLASVSTVYDSDGIPVAVVAANRDITDRKLAELALQEREQELREAQKIARLGNWRYDFAAGRAEWSDEIYELYGVHKDSFSGSFAEYVALVHPEDRSHVSRLTDGLDQGQQEFEDEYRIIRPDGEIRYLHSRSRVQVDAAGAKRYLVGTVQDITPLKQAEEAERAQRLLAQTLQETAESLLGAQPLHENLQTILERLAEIMPFDQGQIGLLQADSLIPGGAVGHTPLAQYPVQRGGILYGALSQNGPVRLQQEAARPDVYQEAIPGLLAPTQDWIGIPLVARDVTVGLLAVARRESNFPEDAIEIAGAFANQAALAVERAGILDELEESLASLHVAQEQLIRTARLSAIGETAAGIAHQINNPLMSVVVDAHLLRKQIPPDHPSYPSVEAVHHGALRAAEVVERLLDFARARPQEIGPVNLPESIETAVALASSQLPPSVRLATDIQPDLPEVMASFSHLQDVWLNLLINATDAVAGQETGQIEVVARKEAQAVASGSGAVRVEIRDNGAGIPPGALDQIFDPFFTTKARGTGLGLAVCREIVEQLAGQINVISTPGAGTTVTVILPVFSADTRHRNNQRKDPVRG